MLILLKEFCDTDTALLLGKLVSEYQTLSPQRWLLQDLRSSVQRLPGF
jgi:hypothetical protein